MTTATIAKGIKLDRVKIENFGCFEHLDFSFDNPTGFFLISGDNGTGKSTLMNAIMWCLYGRTARGAKAGKLLNRNQGKGYSVILYFDSFTISRSWNPNSLKLSSQGNNFNEIEQVALDEFLSLTVEQFQNTIYCGQAAPGFVDLSAAEKLNFLSEVFNLDRWTRCSDKCKEYINEFSSSLAKFSGRKDQIDKECDSIKIQIESLKGESNEWKTKQSLERAERQREIELVKEDLSEETPINEIETVCQEFALQINNLEAQLKEAQFAKQTTQKAIAANKREIEVHTKRIVDLKNIIGSVCPTCEQEWDAYKQSKVVDSIYEELIQPLEQKVVLQEEKDAQSDTQITYISTQIAAVKENNQEAQALWSQIKIDNETRKARLKYIGELEATLLRLSNEKNPYDKQLEIITNRFYSLVKEYKEVNENIKKTDNNIATYTYWSKKFPEVRLSILDEVITELEIHMNAAFMSLGLHDWSLSVATERELKNESVKRELTLRIKQGSKEIELDSLSGGEHQKVKIACFLGISDLIKSRTGIHWNLLLLDEPCQALFESGIEKLLDMLSQISDSSLIFLAEHRILSLGRFDRVYTTIKDTNGNSTIEV
jgi:DNA repair exonuclease SbcCD ATPase subunit